MQRKLEAEKMERYFPAASKDPTIDALRRIRGRSEFEKIDRVFTYTIAVGNLFSATSLFENYMILLVKEIDGDVKAKFKDEKGSGFSKALNYLKRNGFRPEKCELYNQMDSIICIRNLIYHAGGHLDWFRDAKKVEKICSDRLYLTKEIRDHRKKIKNVDDEIVIVDSIRGKRLQISNNFSHYSASIFRDYFAYLYKAVKEETPGSSG